MNSKGSVEVVFCVTTKPILACVLENSDDMIKPLQLHLPHISPPDLHQIFGASLVAIAQHISVVD